MSALTFAFRQADPEVIRGLSRQDIPEWLRTLYASRGIKSPSEIDTKLSGLLHYGSMSNIDSAARRLAKAIENSEQIVVVGDYDADGATATATAILGLRMLGAHQPQFVVPNRFAYGYGLSPEIVMLAAEHKPKLIVTVDNGIAAYSGVEKARSMGIDILVTDHHLAGDTLPDTELIVNPNQHGCQFAGKNTAGVGVLFYTLLATRAVMMDAGKFTPENRPKLENLLDLVALGTVADVVKLDENNRRLVAAGLKRIRIGCARPLIRSLYSIGNRPESFAIAGDLGFYVGPRLNAAGRMDDMSLGIQGLIESDTGRAREIAQALEQINQDRKETQKQMEEEAAALACTNLSPHLQSSLVLHQAEWHEGIIGLVASRMKEQHWLPTIVFCQEKDGHLKGSGRSIPGLHLRDALDWVDRKLPGAIIKFGGHAMAAGLTIHRESLEAFQRLFDQVCKEWLTPEALQRKLMLDTPPDFDAMDVHMAQTIESLVWGQGFEEPIFGSRLPIVSQEVFKDKHLRFVAHFGNRRVKGICFNRTTHIGSDELVAWRLTVNRWNGTANASIQVEQTFPAAA